MKLKEMRGNLLLLITAIIWGSAFVAQSEGMKYIGPFTFQAVRSVLGALVLVPFIVKGNLAKKKEGLPYRKNAKMLWLGGLVCGGLLALSGGLQQLGIQYTTVGKAGFITALYILFVPLLGIFMKKKVAAKVWIAIGIAVAGLYLLCMQDGFSLSVGDTYVALCAAGFSFHILAVDYFAARVDGLKLSCLQFLFCAVFSAVPMVMGEQVEISGIMQAWLPLVYGGVLSSGVGYTLQVLGQKYTKPAIASLLMSLESVFAVLAGIILLKQIPSVREAAGCILMFGAIILAQLPDKKSQEKE